MCKRYTSRWKTSAVSNLEHTFILLTVFLNSKQCSVTVTRKLCAGTLTSVDSALCETRHDFRRLQVGRALGFKLSSIPTNTASAHKPACRGETLIFMQNQFPSFRVLTWPVSVFLVFFLILLPRKGFAQRKSHSNRNSICAVCRGKAVKCIMHGWAVNHLHRAVSLHALSVCKRSRDQPSALPWKGKYVCC